MNARIHTTACELNNADKGKSPDKSHVDMILFADTCRISSYPIRSERLRVLLKTEKYATSTTECKYQLCSFSYQSTAKLQLTILIPGFVNNNKTTHRICNSIQLSIAEVCRYWKFASAVYRIIRTTATGNSHVENAKFPPPKKKFLKIPFR